MWIRICVFVAVGVAVSGVGPGQAAEGKTGLTIRLERPKAAPQAVSGSERSRCEALRSRLRRPCDCIDPTQSPLIIDTRKASQKSVTRP